MEFLTSIIIWMLAVYGTALIISMSTIFEPIRRGMLYSSYKVNPHNGDVKAVERRWKFPGKLISCIMCMGFWSGVFWAWAFFDPMALVQANEFLHLLFCGVLGCGSTWFIHANLHHKMKGL